MISNFVPSVHHPYQRCVEFYVSYHIIAFVSTPLGLFDTDVSEMLN